MAMEDKTKSFFGKLGTMAKTVSEKAVDSIEINRINGDIYSERHRIEKLKQDLGEYYWAQFATGESLHQDAMLICDKVVACHDRIRAFQEEIKKIQQEQEVGVVVEEEPFIQPGHFCRSCGSTIEEGKKFCSECGTPAE